MRRTTRMPRAADDVGVDLLDGVLVAADDDRRRVDVEEQQVVVRHLGAEDVLLEREIEARVGDVAVVDEEHEERCIGERPSALEWSSREERDTSSDYAK